MAPARSMKPLVSSALALLFVLAFVLPFTQTAFIAGPTTSFDWVQAGSIHWGIIIAIAMIWLAVQLFWSARTESTKLGQAASATIVWLALAFFFPFKTNAEWGGPVAFFTLVGGLGLVLVWVRFLSDELSF